MISLTQFEHAVRSVLIGRAQRADAAVPATACLTVTELGKAVGAVHGSYPMVPRPRHWLVEARSHVSMYEVERGRPMLTALVVHKNEWRPGRGFAQLARYLGFEVGWTLADEVAFWRAELAEVVRVWTSDDPTMLLDGGIGVILKESRTARLSPRRGR